MNAYVNIDWIAAEALMILSDSLIIAPLTARDKTADFMVTPNGYKVGDTVRIKTGPDYTARDFDADGNVINKQKIRSTNRSMTIEHLFDVSVEIGAKEKRLNFEGFSTEVIQPAARRLAEKCDQYVGTKILNALGLYTSDNLYGSAADIALARKDAKYQQLTMNRFCLVNDSLEAKLLGQEWFNQSQTRGAPGVDSLQSGNMGRVMGMGFSASTNFPVQSWTAGDAAATTDNGAGGNTNNQPGATVLHFDAGTGSLTAGDHIRIAGVRRPLTVTTDGAIGVSGTIALVDPITEIIPDNAAITVVGSGQALDVQGAIFDDQSMGVAMPLLDTPSDKPSSVISDNGYSIRVVQGYDMDNKTETMSLDLLIGAEAYDNRRITKLAEY